MILERVSLTRYIFFSSNNETATSADGVLLFRPAGHSPVSRGSTGYSFALFRTFQLPRVELSIETFFCPAATKETKTPRLLLYKRQKKQKRTTTWHLRSALVNIKEFYRIDLVSLSVRRCPFSCLLNREKLCLCLPPSVSLYNQITTTKIGSEKYMCQG